MRRIILGALAVSLVLGGVAMAGGACCDKAKAENGWCATCKEGFMCNVEIAKEALYKALTGVAYSDKCEGCKKAAETSGICDKCHVGIVSGKAYKALPVYYVLHGKKMEGDKITCEACASVYKSGASGWCDKCKAGQVAGYGFTAKPEYEKANSSLVIIQIAAKNSCDTCGIAIVTDGTCEHCKITYKDGKPSKT